MSITATTRRISSAAIFGVGVVVAFFGLRLLGAVLGLLPMNEFMNWMANSDKETFETTLDAVVPRERAVEQWALAPLSILLVLALMSMLPFERRSIDFVAGSVLLACVVSFGVTSGLVHGLAYFALASLLLRAGAAVGSKLGPSP